jgi:hypothetical protein
VASRFSLSIVKRTKAATENANGLQTLGRVAHRRPAYEVPSAFPELLVAQMCLPSQRTQDPSVGKKAMMPDRCPIVKRPSEQMPMSLRLLGLLAPLKLINVQRFHSDSTLSLNLLDVLFGYHSCCEIHGQLALTNAHVTWHASFLRPPQNVLRATNHGAFATRFLSSSVFK